MKPRLTAAVILVLIFVSLPAARLAAQNAEFDKIAPESLPAAPMETTSTASSKKPERVFDKKFIVVMGALGGAESFRFTSRQLVLDHEFAAGAPWVTRAPANQPVMAKGLTLYAAEFLLTYELKKSHSWLPGDRVIRKLWWAYPAGMTAIHIKNAIGNVRTQGPGSCTSIECAEQSQ
jgi:hypothetical protein